MKFTQQGFSVIGFLVTLAALAVIGGGIYYLWVESTPAELAQGVTNPQTEESVQATVAAAPTTGEFRSSLPRLVSRGDTLECDWRMPVEQPDSPFNTGKLWTMGNQGRSQINGTLNGVDMEASAIYKDNAAYTWMTFNTTKMGFKFSKEQLESQAETMTPEQRQQAMQIREEMIFNCRAWNPQPEKFVLPSDITFREM
jgi:hypothetical protein